jgi:hypothetical protein
MVTTDASRPNLVIPSSSFLRQRLSNVSPHWWFVLVLLLAFGIVHPYFCAFTRRLCGRILLL